jgi:hypothetical protein
LQTKLTHNHWREPDNYREKRCGIFAVLDLAKWYFRGGIGNELFDLE